MGVNPPGFTWTPSDKAKAYRLEVRETASGAGIALAEGPLTSTVCPPRRRLPPGEYAWQVVYLDGAGGAAGVSKTRRFRVPPDAPVLLMPDVAALQARLAGVRPRLFLAGGRLPRLRDAVKHGGVPSWERLRQAADAALAEPSYPEPAPYNGKYSDVEWLRVFTPAKIASAHVARTALAWRITGEPRYREGFRRWMTTLASWDPRGITSHGLRLADGTVGNDEASMPMLERMSFGWDWAGGELTAAERARTLAAITERGNQVLARLVKDDFLSHPFNNHSGRVLAFLGEAGLAFLGDIPDAEKWLDYVLRCYLTSYPSWGSDAGGWAQGLSYWSFYVYNLTNFAEALRQVSDTDLFQRPFYRHTGYLPLYFHPAYASMGGFGDGAYHPPSEVEGLLTDFLADTFRDPRLKWQAQEVLRAGEKNTTKWREWFMEDVISTWRAAAPSGVGQDAPAGQPDARQFPDIGWVAMHSALGDAKNDVWAAFKSSRYGSFSHSHADQNSFQLYAYGRALAIDSGYYPSYGTPHDNLWTRQTRAHNAILVNGRGQPPHTWEAGGEIATYEQQGPITLVRGEAAGAYNVPQPAGIAALWNKLLPGTLPSMEPKVEECGRTVAFVASRTRPFLVVHDYVKTAAPATFEWLLHALHEMETDSRTGAIFVRDGDARLAVRLVATAPFQFTQTSRFPVQPEAASNTAYVLAEPEFRDQWHASAATRTPAAEVKFLAVLVPYRASEAPPEIVPLNENGTAGFRIGGARVAAWWGAGSHGRIAAGGLTGSGRLVVRVRDGGGESTAVAR